VGGDPQRYSGDELVYDRPRPEIRVPLYTESLSHQKIPKISLPRFKDPGEIYRWLRRENLPGYFPFTAGVFPMKRVGEDPTRMFAGEGDPARTNRRFKLLSANSEAKRLSTAFDSVTLYGYDPDRRPDIYGKVGNSGVSVCTLDDVKVLYRRVRAVRPQHLRLHDHQRTGAHHAGHVSQYGHRPAGGQIYPGKGPSAPGR
jgi:methylmalonyl-CoA mutase